MPATPLHMARPVIEVAPGGSASDIQHAVDLAARQSGRRPIVHLPFGVYAIDRTLVVPASDIQVVGDGARTVLRWSGTGRGPLVDFRGPGKATFREFQLDGAKTADGLVVESADQPGARAYLDQVQLHPVRRSGLFVDGLNNVLVELWDVGYADSPAGASIRATGRGRDERLLGRVERQQHQLRRHGEARGSSCATCGTRAAPVPALPACVPGRRSPSTAPASHLPPTVRSPPSISQDLDGNVAILSADLDDRVIVSGDGSAARVLGLAIMAERASSDYFLNRAAPPAAARLAASRQRRAGGPGNRSVPTPDVGTPVSDNPGFVRSLLAQARGEVPHALEPLPPGVTDFRMFRVTVVNGVTNIDLQP